MTWVLASLLALAAFALAATVLKAPRGGWEAIAAALLFGIAGYGLQGSPSVPGAPKPAAQTLADNPAALVEARQGLAGQQGVAADKWLVVSDALARNGEYANAAAVLLGAVERNPANGEAWLAMANALVSHADDQLTPASLYAFERAANAAPGNPGPLFFLGLALAQSGRFADARRLWGELLAQTPRDAPWRRDLEMRLAQLDQAMASQAAAPRLAR